MQNQGEGLLQTLVSAFRDADLGMSRYNGFPFVQDPNPDTTTISYSVHVLQSRRSAYGRGTLHPWPNQQTMCCQQRFGCEL